MCTYIPKATLSGQPCASWARRPCALPPPGCENTRNSQPALHLCSEFTGRLTDVDLWQLWWWISLFMHFFSWALGMIQRKVQVSDATIGFIGVRKAGTFFSCTAASQAIKPFGFWMSRLINICSKPTVWDMLQLVIAIVYSAKNVSVRVLHMQTKSEHRCTFTTRRAHGFDAGTWSQSNHHLNLERRSSSKFRYPKSIGSETVSTLAMRCPIVIVLYDGLVYIAIQLSIVYHTHQKYQVT